MSLVASKPNSQQTVNMGEVAILANDESAQAILGSCLGIVVYEPQQRIGALAHAVLPLAEGRIGPPGKFVDTAIPWILKTLCSKGANPRKLICKLTGGSNMFSGNGPFQIGQQNIIAARRELAKLNIHIAAEHLEGTKGRRITFATASGELTIEVAGSHAALI